MFKLDCSQTHNTFSCDYDQLSPISRGCHFNYICRGKFRDMVKTAYIGHIHTETDYPSETGYPLDNSRRTDNTF